MGGYPEWVRGRSDLPWDDPGSPCDNCEDPPEGFDCNEGENFENCPRYDPQPIYCDGCGKPVTQAHELCKVCTAEEARQQQMADNGMSDIAFDTWRESR